MNTHDWISWLRERDAHVLLLTLVQAIAHPQAALDGPCGLRSMVEGWRQRALEALDNDNWQACIDKHLEVWVDARFAFFAEPASLETEREHADDA
jgi:hypothetical protein